MTQPSSQDRFVPDGDDPSSSAPGTGIRRTHLAQERTYLAWLRSGLAAFAVGLGASKIIPAVAHQTSWPYTALGVGYATVGIACVAYGFARQKIVSRAIEEGRFVKLDQWFSAALATATVLLGVATAILAAS